MEFKNQQRGSRLTNARQAFCWPVSDNNRARCRDPGGSVEEAYAGRAKTLVPAPPVRFRPLFSTISIEISRDRQHSKIGKHYCTQGSIGARKTRPGPCCDRRAQSLLSSPPRIPREAQTMLSDQGLAVGGRVAQRCGGAYIRSERKHICLITEKLRKYRLVGKHSELRVMQIHGAPEGGPMKKSKLAFR